MSMAQSGAVGLAGQEPCEGYYVAIFNRISGPTAWGRGKKSKGKKEGKRETQPQGSGSGIMMGSQIQMESE